MKRETLWDCQDDIEEMFEALNDVFHGKYGTVGNHGNGLEPTFGDDGSTLSHFFASGSWAGLGPTMQDIVEASGPRGVVSPVNVRGDTNRDTASAYLGSRIADNFDTWSECKCRDIARLFRDGKMNFTDIFGNPQQARDISPPMPEH